MKRSIVAIGVLFLLALGGQALAADGQEVFMAQKCNMCHAVSSAGIEAKTTSDKMKGPDLAGKAEGYDDAWFAKYLRKQDQLDGKDHKKEAKATDEEIAALLAWLKTQKN